MRRPSKVTGKMKSVALGFGTITLTLGLVVALTPTLGAFGLKTPFIEVNLGCLEPGGTFSVVERRRIPLSVTNVGDEPVQLVIEVVRPSLKELRQGYEAIPDINWIRFQQDRFVVGPGKNAITNVFITVPDDERYVGHKYQAWLWSHTPPGGGITAGLRSLLLFSICEE